MKHAVRILKRYFARSETDFIFRRIISLLLQGIALHAVEGDTADYDRFRKDFDRIQSAATERTNVKELLVTAGAANQAIADYAYRTSRFIRQQGTLLHNIISMLTQTMVSIGAGSERSAEYLQEIERELAKAAVIEDIQELKLRLGACLENMREESTRQKLDAQVNAAQIREQVERAHYYMRKTSALTDRVEITGELQTQSAAKAAIEEALQAPGRKYVVAIVVDRIESINSRFGSAVGERVLKSILELLSVKLSSADRLFRWSGPALVALLERDQPIDAVRAEIGKIGCKNLERFFDIGGHPVLLPVAASCLVIPLAPPVTAISESVENFIESHTESPVVYCR